ncbi:MAG TPA: PcfJ domain-containing protein [Candidatus Saccharimonadales bacterium]
MEILTTQEGYSPETLIVMERMGEDRLGALQAAIDEHSGQEAPSSAGLLIEGMVTRHTQAGKQGLEEIGYSTVADSLAEIGTSKGATRALLRGKMGLQRAVEAHHQRALQAAKAQYSATLRELGILGTTTIYVDQPTDLHIVHLSTPEHYQYEGVSLVHCLGDLVTANEYHSRGALLYSLREGGVEPRATLEVDAQQAAVTQARTKHDQPLHENSGEYHALRRGLVPLAAHVAKITHPQLTITDKVLSNTGNGVVQNRHVR